jgi:thiol-disulfide isomerase/thioredoxin
MDTIRTALLAACLLLPLGAAAPRAAQAEGAMLDELMAPELTFQAGLNGIEPGTKLSSFRGRVVLIKFWLRDCPRCRKTLPDAQRLHDLYGKSGLVVLTIVHQHGPDQMKKFLEAPPPLPGDPPGWKRPPYTFRVASDPTGTLAQAYQVNHRPTDYVIGINGRVKASNSAPEDVMLRELAAYREKELGTVPRELDEDVKDSVRKWKYGRALKLAKAAAAKPDASAEVREFAARLEALVKSKVEADIEFATTLGRLNDAARAKQALEALVADYADTPFAARAKQALEAFGASAAN